MNIFQTRGIYREKRRDLLPLMIFFFSRMETKRNLTLKAFFKPEFLDCYDQEELCKEEQRIQILIIFF